MTKINPFDLPEEYTAQLLLETKEKNEALQEAQMQLDLHDDYDLLSQPLRPNRTYGGLRYEGK